MKVVCGLGNPGTRYAGTRHNVGFAVIDTLARSAQVGRFQHRWDADLAEIQDGEQRILLVKPLAYMNLSGRCLRQVLEYHQIALPDALVVCDDINLPLGQLRVRAKGSHGGHNGLRDIQHQLGTTEYARLRIGVGAPEGGDAADYVLDRFRPAEKAVIEDAILGASQAAGVWWRRGIAACMNEFNAKK